MRERVFLFFLTCDQLCVELLLRKISFVKISEQRNEEKHKELKHTPLAQLVYPFLILVEYRLLLYLFKQFRVAECGVFLFFSSFYSAKLFCEAKHQSNCFFRHTSRHVQNSEAEKGERFSVRLFRSIRDSTSGKTISVIFFFFQNCFCNKIIYVYY